MISVWKWDLDAVVLPCDHWKPPRWPFYEVEVVACLKEECPCGLYSLCSSTLVQRAVLFIDLRLKVWDLEGDLDIFYPPRCPRWDWLHPKVTQNIKVQWRRFNSQLWINIWSQTRLTVGWTLYSSPDFFVSNSSKQLNQMWMTEDNHYNHRATIKSCQFVGRMPSQ